MMILYDFKCGDCSHIEEHLVRYGLREDECKACGGLAHRVIGTPSIHLDGTDSGFPTAHDRWAKAHEKAGKSRPE